MYKIIDGDAASVPFESHQCQLVSVLGRNVHAAASVSQKRFVCVQNALVCVQIGLVRQKSALVRAKSALVCVKIVVESWMTVKKTEISA